MLLQLFLVAVKGTMFKRNIISKKKTLLPVKWECYKVLKKLK